MPTVEPHSHPVPSHGHAEYATKQYVDSRQQAQQVESTSVNWNSLVTAGMHRNLMHGVNNLNGPGRSHYYYLTVYQYGAQVTQVAYPYGAFTNDVPAIMMRTLYNNTWSSWAFVGGGNYVNFTPTVSGVSVQSSSCRYSRNGNTAHAYYNIAFSAAPTGEVSVGLPLAAYGNAATVIVPVRLILGSSYNGIALYNSPTSILVRSIRPSDGVYVGLSATVPAAWAAGHGFVFNVTYETTGSPGSTT